MEQTKRGIDWRLVYELAFVADCSHHTVLRALRGKQITGSAGHRLASTLQAYGINTPQIIGGAAGEH